MEASVPSKPAPKTSAGTAVVLDILNADPTRACGALSAALPVQESVPVIRRHKRAATMLDGSQPPEVPKRPAADHAAQHARQALAVGQPGSPAARASWAQPIR